MIVRSRPHLIKLFFVMRGSIVPRIMPKIVGFAIYSAIIVAVVRWLDVDLSNFGIGPFAILAVALSIFLGFRNGAAYDRWWEGRKLWGALIHETRSLARATGILVPDEEARRRLLYDALAFAHLLRGALRRTDASADASRYASKDYSQARNGADAAVRQMGAQVGALYRAGVFDTIGLRLLDDRLAAFSALQAGCERISGTPLPFAYTLLLHRSIYIICLLLPFGLIGTMGMATPLLSALVAYSFFGLDALAEELEEPFGMEANDLALDSMCRVCEISVMEALGEMPPPEHGAERYFVS